MSSKIFVMKKIIFSTVLFLSLSLVHAQNYEYQITEGTVPGQEYAVSFGTNIIGANEDFVKYNWQKFVKKQGGTTYLVKSDFGNFEFESEHVSFPALGGEEVTLHSRFTPNDDETGVELTIWIENGDGTYYSIKESKNSGDEIKKWLRSFNKKVMKINRSQRW